MMEHHTHNVFQALADPTRRAILSLLTGQRLPAGRIAHHFSRRRPAISKHLTILKQAGLLQEDRFAQQRLYSIRIEAVMPIMDWLSNLEAPTGDERVVTPPKCIPVSICSIARYALS